MSDDATPLAPTVSNFDAIVARNTAKAEAAEAQGGDESADAPDFYKLEQQKAKEQSPDLEPPDDDGELDDGEGEQQPDPMEAPDPDAAVEQEFRAPVKALREAIKSKTLTPELMEAIGDCTMELKLPGGVRKVKLSEMPTGFMLQSRFNREMEKAKDIQAQSQNIVQMEQARTQAWRTNPGALLRGLQAMGCEQALQHVWHHLTEQRYNYLKASPEERQRMDQWRQIEAQRAQEQQRLMLAEQELEKLRRQQAPQQVDPVTKQIEDHVLGTMDSALAKAFKTHGINSRAVGHPQKLFFDNLRLLSEGAGPEALDMIDEHIAMAADLAAEAYKGMLQAGVQQQQRKEPKQELSPKRGPSGTAPQRDESTGRFQAPKPNGKGKPKPTVDEWNRRFAR